MISYVFCGYKALACRFEGISQHFDAFSKGVALMVGVGAGLRLYYFPLLAKGLGPAIVAEMSGLPWQGPKDLGFTRDDWPKLKAGRDVEVEPCWP